MPFLQPVRHAPVLPWVVALLGIDTEQDAVVDLGSNLKVEIASRDAHYDTAAGQGRHLCQPTEMEEK